MILQNSRTDIADYILHFNTEFRDYISGQQSDYIADYNQTTFHIAFQIAFVQHFGQQSDNIADHNSAHISVLNFRHNSYYISYSISYNNQTTIQTTIRQQFRQNSACISVQKSDFISYNISEILADSLLHCRLQHIEITKLQDYQQNTELPL